MVAKKMYLSKYFDVTFLFLSPPSSKCLHLLRGSCFLYLHTVHSKRSTIFLVVFAWTTKRGKLMQFEKPTHRWLILKKGHDRKKTREIEIKTLLDYFLLRSPHLSVIEKLIKINLTTLDRVLFSSLTELLSLWFHFPGVACIPRYHGHVE